MYNVGSSVEKIDEIITNLGDQSLEVRRKAAIRAQYAVLGYPPVEKTNQLLEALAMRLTAKVNGHVMLTEPDEHVRECCANAFEVACSTGKNIEKYVPVLLWSRDNDPHQWVRSMAKDAIDYHQSPKKQSDLPLPRQWRLTQQQEPLNIGSEVKRLRERREALSSI